MSDSAFLFDVNVWVALAFADHPHHPQALAAYAAASEQRRAVFCRSTQQSFLRIATNPAFLRLSNVSGFTNRDALVALDRIMASRVVAYRDEPSKLEPTWYRLALRDTASPKVWMDAYLAAFAICGDLRLVTLDKDFATYQRDGLKLDLLNPAT